MQNNWDLHLDFLYNCAEAISTIVEAPHIKDLFVERLNLILADDIESYGNRIPHSTLVEHGLPVEFSISFQSKKGIVFRFAAEPFAYLPVNDRGNKTATRLYELAEKIGLSAQKNRLKKIYETLTAFFETSEPIVGWFMHVSLTLEKNAALRVYFAPFPFEHLGNIQKWRVFKMTVFERITKIFRLCDMEDQVSTFEQVYNALCPDEQDTGDRFITFLGVDFRANTPVGLKVYFNPQPSNLDQDSAE